MARERGEGVVGAREKEREPGEIRGEKRKEKEIPALVFARAHVHTHTHTHDCACNTHAHILILAGIRRSCATHMYRAGSKLRNFVQIAREGSRP